MPSSPPTPSLDEQLAAFARRRFLAMPLAGTIAWLVVGIGGLFLSLQMVVLVLFVATGFIAYLGMFLSKFTGEDFLAKDKPKNRFDSLFFHTVGMALVVYAIAIPFFVVEPTSLPLSVGILTGLMWLPISWLIRHWIGIFHTVARTLLIVALWYLLPDHRFVAIPLAIVLVYGITIFVLESRWRALGRVSA